MRLFADGSAACSTTSGTIPPNAGKKNPSPSPARNASAISAPNVRCPVASKTAIVPTTTRRARSDAIIIERRGKRSASAPPISNVASSPIPWARKTIPSLDEPTSMNPRQARTVKNAASPISEIAWPIHRRRKSRCRNASKMRTRESGGAVSASTAQRYRPIVYAPPDVDAWRERLPRLVEECVEQWSLTLGNPYAQGAGGFTAPAEFRDGTPAVLKVVLPHRESEHEADALAAWGGAGAVELLARDDRRFAMLIERCDPGTPLALVGADSALDVFVALLPRLWVQGGDSFHTVASEAAWWASYLPEKWERAASPFDRALLDVAMHALGSLPGTQGELVLLHQDLHAENVLAAQREPWLAIDPKPLPGERER